MNGKFVHVAGVGSTVGFGVYNEVQFAPLRTSIYGKIDCDPLKSFNNEWTASGFNHIYPTQIEIFTPEKGSRTGVKTGFSVIVKNGVVDFYQLL